MVNANYLPKLQSKEKEFDFWYKRAGIGKARYGEIKTPHGIIETPAFIFCATKGTMKGISIPDLKELNTQIILSNTYHLMLKPGHEYIKEKGGLAKFSGWNGPMFTDSGGFQIFSLGLGEDTDELKRRFKNTSQKKKEIDHKKLIRRKNYRQSILKVTKEGVLCRSYYDGSKHLLTPEKSIEIQVSLGADLIVVLDECFPFTDDYLYTRDSMEATHKWSNRSIAEFQKHDDEGKQKLYGIIHGGIFKDLRKKSAIFNNEKPFFGQAIGGSLGQNKNQMEEIIQNVMETAHSDRPTHLLGVGGISDILMGVKYGIDTFDCVHPTRIARHGGALVKRLEGREYINLRNSKYKNDESPIENDCECKICKNYSRAYLNYLLSARESIVFNFITYHNVYFMNKLMSDIRASLRLNTYDDLCKKYLAI